MATKKSTKTTAKKTTKASAARKTKPVKAPVKRKTTKKKPEMKSFRVSPRQEPFMSMSPTRQTLYWLILGLVVIAFTVWILQLQSDIQDIYDSIDYAEASSY